MKIAYISGPITGYEAGNRPAFDKAKQELSRVYKVISPFDDETVEETATTLGDPYGDLYWKVLAKDLIKLSKAQVIVLLPKWKLSKGARLEAFAGLLSDKTFQSYVGGDRLIQELRNWEVADALRESVNA